LNKTIDIQEIIAGCLRSQSRYQRALVDRYSGLLYVICNRYLGDSFSAQDALQDSLMRIFEKLSSYDAAKGNFESWASTVTIRVCLGKLRANKRSKEFKLIYHSNQETGSADLEKEMMANINKDQLLEIVACLPGSQRTVFNLAAIDGYSHKEIAEELKITEINSRSILRRARTFLKEQIAQQNNRESWVNTI